ncbi:leukocyte elastase inhibitor-like [Battus philenor]|uniref:leukocyte elastase inhibitor-like n=1 Tax=Battus philenor TaxID=42288 RepID=UPI0035CFEFBA
MKLKLFIVSCILIWKAESQRRYNSYQQNTPNLDFEQVILGNLRNLIPGFGHDIYGGNDNLFSTSQSKNDEQSYVNNGLGTEKRALTYPQNVQTQQPIYQTSKQQQQQPFYQSNSQQQSSYANNQQPQQNYQQNQQPQQQSKRQQNSNNYQQDEQTQQQFGSLKPQNTQTTQQDYQQNFQSQQPNYQQSTNPRPQNFQTQQQNYQQGQQPQVQNFRPQQPNYQQNSQPQVQNQKKQPNYQQQQSNYHHQQQQQQPNYQQQQPNHQQQQPNYQQNYQQNLQPQNFKQSNTQVTNGILSSKFDADDTGKTSQNANYNKETFAITRFGLKLLKGLNSQGNIVLSPYSIAMLLALVQQGARGYTQQEITTLLQLKPETSASLFKGLTSFIKKRGSNNILKIATNVVLDNAFTINPAFKSTAIQNFNSEVNRMDLSNSYEAARRINNWVAGKTQKITNLLAPESIQPDTLTILVNAVYFKGTWDIKFRKELTMPKNFTLSNGYQTTVPFMQARRTFQTDIDLVIKSQILLLPFEGNQYSMMFILPLEGNDINTVMSSLTEPQLYSYLNMPPKEVQLEIPRFTIQQDSDVARLLSDLGVWTMFSDQADLSGMGTSPRVSSGVHSAVLSIDENGGSAAAATAYSVVALSYDDPSTSFKADRPFLAIIWDNQLSMPIFMAKIEDPTS